MRLIDADALRERMYHDAFETDTDMQKWESGCWIRYKMFENAMDSAPTIDAVEVVRCKECNHWHSGVCWGIPFNGDDASYIETEADDYCSYGERKSDE